MNLFVLKDIAGRQKSLKVQLFFVRVDWFKSVIKSSKNHMQFWSFMRFVWHI